MSISWPEKKPKYQMGDNPNYVDGYNAGIDACIKAEAESKKLVELDIKNVAEYFYVGYEKECQAIDTLSRVKFDKWEELPKDDKMRLAFIKAAENFCAIFGIPPTNTSMDNIKIGTVCQGCKMPPAMCICAQKANTLVPKPRPVVTVDIAQCVAQGWCTERNKHKAMDSDLAMDIAQAIYNKLNEEGE